MNKKFFIIGILLFAIITVTVINIFSKNAPKEVEIKQNFSHVEVETDNADIVFIASKGETAKIELENGNSKYKLNANVKGDTLEIEIDHKWFKLFSFDFFSKTPILKVYLPENLAGTINAETDNGTIKASDLASKEFSVETNNGEVYLSNLKVTALFAESDNGEIFLDNIDGEIVGESSNGDISLKNKTLNQPADLETNNGTIFIQTKNAPQNVKIEADTDNGEIIVLGNSNSTTIFGEGKELIKLKSNNGDIIVEN
ncbi:putative adhesin [Ureibacillus xyleni]|uniref:Putative adhesin n=1 Tax=Ureibacillus xyleni TaxID=614648 RepID=A0A285RYC0_9BACL|nr:DUF4097 family beta strand repeat-containing protein [Ureibacillus xyleni]SOB99582.1 putative adhesin [Ureibacillus xyleni]